MPSYAITIYDNQRWDRVIRNAHMYDVCHTWHYHSTAAHGEPVLFVYEEKDDFIALPLLKQRINNTDLFEGRSICGYAGPVASRSFALQHDGIQERFEISLLGYLERQRIVSVSTRLHPVIHQYFTPLHAGRLFNNDDSLLIDLSLAPEQQHLQYGENFRTGMHLLRRKGYTVREALAINDVDKFADIYRQNMQRVKANIAYQYDKAWFRQMLRPAGFNSTLLLACQGPHITAGALLTSCNGIMQLHLAATHENYLQDAPLHLLLEEAGMLGKSLGMQYLHLGGMAGRPDALFACKAISQDTYPGFKTWGVVEENLLLKRPARDRQSQVVMV